MTSPIRLGIISLLLFSAFAAFGQTDPGAVDTTNRAAVLSWYNQWWPLSYGANMGFTGDVTKGIVGDTSAAWKNEVLLRANIFRRLAGEQPLSLDTTLNATDQSAALILSANYTTLITGDPLSDMVLPHNPPKSSLYYSTIGAQGCANSNLTFGDNGPTAIYLYTVDYGAANVSVGHRLHMLDPVLSTSGTGDFPITVVGSTTYPATNAFWIQAPTGSLNYSSDYVTWPSKGYFPQTLIPGRWSLISSDQLNTFNGVQFDFSSANVSVTKNGTVLSVLANAYGNSIVFTLDGTSEGVGSGGTTVVNGEVLPWGPELTTADQTYHVVITGVKTASGGLYNGTGQIVYDVVAFNPSPTAPSTTHMINISTRSIAGTGSSTQIAGFILSGSSSRKVLIRAGGPYLTQFTVSNVLADPVLTLYDGTTSIASNDDWGSDAADVTAATVQAGATPFSVGSKDAALVATLQPGHAYSAQVTSKDGSSGNAIVEVYDADSSINGTTLTNISTRSYVGTGASIQIAGFILHGSGPRNVLIRAGGPYLTQFTVTNVLADPVLTIFQGTTQIASNDDWGTNAASVTAATSSAGIVPYAAGSTDSAIVLTLNPDVAYTAQVSGKNGGTGNALIEVFALP